MSATPPPSGSRPLCPICRRKVGLGPEAARLRPFCSKRCADIDLHRWLSGGYRVETDETPSTAGDVGPDER